MKSAIILYGPPGSGKDTVTRELTNIDSKYRLFPRLKCGPGRTAGYRVIDRAKLAEIRSIPGEVVWENDRYGATYVVDRSHILALIGSDLVPVVHLGQRGGIDRVKQEMPEIDMLVVELQCSRSASVARIVQRGNLDIKERLAAFDATEPLNDADVTIDTETVSPAMAAAVIDRTARIT